MPTLASSRYGAAEDSWRPQVGRSTRVRALAVAAASPVITGYAAIAALLALTSALATGARFSTLGVLVAAGPGWLAAWHVPVDITGHELGVLPLLPTFLLMLLVARSAATAADRIEAATPSSSAPVLTVMSLTHGLFGAVLAMISATPAVSCSPVLAFFLCGVLSLLGATAGVARPCGYADAVRARATPAVLVGLRSAVVAVCGLLAAGTLVLIGALIASWPTVVETFRLGAPGFGSGLGMLLLSIAYLPNILVGVCSFIVGPGASIGHAAIGPIVFQHGPVPALPILAMVPEHQAGWWPALLVLPLAVGVAVGWFIIHASGSAEPAQPDADFGHARPDTAAARRRTRARADRHADPAGRQLEAIPARLQAALTGTLSAAVLALALAALSGGALAGGRFDPVTVPAGLFAVLLFVSTTLGAALTVWLSAPRSPLTKLIPTQSHPDEADLEADWPTDDDIDTDTEDPTFDDPGAVSDPDGRSDSDALSDPAALSDPDVVSAPEALSDPDENDQWFDLDEPWPGLDEEDLPLITTPDLEAARAADPASETTLASDGDREADDSRNTDSGLNTASSRNTDNGQDDVG
ncbi:MAG TPA: DUF6350 family protein [Pseudonocardiaceae bacterium]|nr:DUF6350 family protein [Pseudonocardiaceae bacterium]